MSMFAGRTRASGQLAGTTAGRSHLGFDRQIALVTLAPWIVFLVAVATGIYPLVLAYIGIALSAPHVLATFGLYADRGLRSHLRAHPNRYLVAPLAIVVASMVAFAVCDGTAVRVLITGFLLWQTHHFTKQNLGVASFWLKARGMSGLTVRQRRLILATDVIGALGILRLVHLVPSMDNALWGAGLVAVAVGIGLAVVPRDLPKTLVLVAAVLFYAPTILFRTDLAAAVAVYGMAHGAQYYLMIGHSIRTQRNVVRMTVPFVLLGGILLVSMGAGDPITSAGWSYGLAKGIVAGHFIVDAGTWKMSDPQIRAHLRSRFAFLG